MLRTRLNSIRRLDSRKFLPHGRCFEIRESNDILPSWYNASDILSGHSFEQAWRYVKAAVGGENLNEQNL